MKTRIRFLCMVSLIIFFAGCTRSLYPDIAAEAPPMEAPAPYPQMRFLVLSDLHYYHPSLGTEGPHFAAYIAGDRKMLAESDAILEAAISRIRKESADFILICGDLTKDGERINHEILAEKLARLHPSAPVFVVPGNHDVRNGESYRYTLLGKEPVPTVSADEFAGIYAAFGYDQALARDPASLSYVAEPVQGLWLLALDSCLWRKNRPGGHPHTNGRFSASSVKWIRSILLRAAEEKKAVIAMMHHGLLEHYPGNEKHYDEYLVDAHEEIADLLAGYGVRLVFTGHFHAQDITLAAAGEEGPEGNAPFVYDIETGSLVTYPSPYRLITISKDQEALVESRFIEKVPGVADDFPAYAEAVVYRGTKAYADAVLADLLVSEEGRDILSPQITRAYIAHLAGDERPPAVTFDPAGAGFMGRIVAFFRKDLINGWWTDLEPPDNHIGIALESGAYFKPISQFQRPFRFFSGTVSGSGSTISTNTR